MSAVDGHMHIQIDCQTDKCQVDSSQIKRAPILSVLDPI